jgi:Zn-dependent protease with chaperone function
VYVSRVVESHALTVSPVLQSVVILGLLVVPLVLCAVRPRVLRYVIALGIAYAGAEWALAYRSNLVEHGGDWTAGSELLAVTGFFALIFFALWFSAALAGWALGRKLRRNA